MTSSKKFGNPDNVRKPPASPYTPDASAGYAVAHHVAPMTLREVPWGRAGIAIVLTLVLALGVHVVMTEVLGIPFPSAPIDAPIAQYISRGALHVLGIVYLNFLIKPALSGRSWLTRWVVVYAIASSLAETLRATLMQGYCTNAVAFSVISELPSYVAEFILVGAVIIFDRFMQNPVRSLVGAALLGAISYFLINPEMLRLSEYLSSILSSMQNEEWCKEPYGWDVKLPAFVTFIEPAFGAFAAVFLSWDRLPKKTVTKVIAFTVMILMIKRNLLIAPIYMMWSGTPPLTGLVSAGQFSLEFIALGLLTSCSWIWIMRGRKKHSQA